jgi:tetratricopeptide (TPR) repeat protein
MNKSKISSTFSKINQFSDSHPILFPFVLLAFALITYGVFIFSLGFYWDDWPPILLSHIANKSIIFQYWSYDRPFQSWTYYLLFPICKDSTALWQLSAIIFRWTAALALYFTFLKVFPRQKNLLQWAAVLFVVFPGFADQSASVAYGSHFMVYTVFGLSLLFMILAFRKPKQFWIFYPISLVLTAAHLFSMEYFAGLELLRPLLMFFLLLETEKKRSKAFVKALLAWLPYIVVFACYTYWRMVIYPKMGTGYGGSNFPFLVTNFLKAPLDTLVTFLQTIYSDFRFLLLDIWTSRIIPVSMEIESATFWLSILIGIGATYLLHFFFRESNDSGLHLTGKEIGRNIVLSLVILFFGMFPIWSTLRQITKGKWSDRFDLPVIFGVLILLLTLLFFFIPKIKFRNLLLILITGLSISYQIQTANDYRKDFNRQKAFYSELAWRIPSLQPGTTLFAPGIPTDKEADYSYSMGINLLYNSGNIDTTLDYWFSGPRYYSPSDLVAAPDTVIQDGLRDFTFTGVASKVVSIKMEDGCLWVIDPYYSLIPEAINQLPSYGKLTNQDLIGETASATNNLSKIIDVAPQKTWCYYFEKGDLAQSKGKYQDAVKEYEQAMSLKLVPLEAIEYLPFVKSYAKLGQVDKAVELTALSFKKSNFAKPSFCQLWKDVMAENSSIQLSSVDSVYNLKNCKDLVP